MNKQKQTGGSFWIIRNQFQTIHVLCTVDGYIFKDSRTDGGYDGGLIQSELEGDLGICHIQK